MTRRSALLLVLSVSALGCDEPPPRHEAPVAAPASGGHATLEQWLPPVENAAPRPAPAAAPTPRTGGAPQYAGTVAETMDAGGYTYMRLDTSSGPVWIAATQREVAVGAQVAASGMMMRDFHSSTLNRTFPELVLASAVEVTPAP